MLIITSRPMADATAWPADSQDSDFLPAPPARVLVTARWEIDWHTDDHGLCAACGSALLVSMPPWPTWR